MVSNASRIFPENNESKTKSLLQNPLNGFAILTYRVGDTKMSSKVKKIDGDKSRKLLNEGGKYTYMEFADRLEIAIRNIRENKKNESI